MKRVFILKGLDCPNCSAKIEKEVGALPGVESSAVNLMQQTLTVQSEKSADATLAEQVETIVHSHEPDVEVSEKTEPAVTKVYLLKGLDCPNCSAKIEKEVGELDGVASSTVNLMNQTLTVQAGTSVATSLLDTVTTIVHSHEPDVEVSEKTEPAVTKVYLLKGLDCPNCSAKIEKEVGELDGVTSSTVNLMNQTLTVQAGTSVAASLLDTVTTIVHSHEPDVEVSEKQLEATAPVKKDEKAAVYNDEDKKRTIRLAVGAVVYARVHSRSGTSSNYGKFERQGSESNDGRRYPGNVLFVPTVSGGIHPTQKPVELCEYLIRTYTRPGELVADICVGSGTTAIAAINTERRFVCFETAPSFYAAASERIRAAQAVKSSGEKGV